MGVTFQQMADETMSKARSISAASTLDLLEKNPDAMLIDVRDESEVQQTGLGARAYNAPGRSLAWLADADPSNEWKDAVFKDRNREIITTCGMSPCYRGAKAANLLAKMGFTNVAYVEGGMQALLVVERAIATRD